MRAASIIIMALSSALGACGSSSAASDEIPGGPQLSVAGTAGFEDLAHIRSQRALFLVPLLSRSEVVTRAALTRRGLGLRLSAGEQDLHVAAVSLRAMRHAVDHQILGSDSGPVLVGPPSLPRAARGSGLDVAWLARRDGNLAAGDDLWLGPVAGDREGLPSRSLVLLPGALSSGGAQEIWVDGSRRVLPLGPQQALLVADPDAQGVQLRLGSAHLDQAFYASVRKTSAEDWLPLEIRTLLRSPAPGASSAPDPQGRGADARPAARPPGGTAWSGKLAAGEVLELWCTPPPRTARGDTWTLAIDLELEGPGTSLGEPPPRTAPAHRGLLHDVADRAGVSMVHFEGPDEQLDIRPTMGPGAAWGDVDGDGWVDLYLVQGGGRQGSEPLPNRLLRNRGDGTFEDISHGSGTDHIGAGMGAAFVDLDGDGDLDLYVSNYGRDVLLENDGTGHFRDVSQRAGLTLDLWSAGIAAADYDLDGDLDLYITGYLDYDLEKLPEAAALGRYQREDPVPMLPFAFPGERNVMLRNEGDMRFSDVTEELGLADTQGRGMQPIFWDFDADGDEDLYLANDVSLNVLYRNEGDGTFTDISFSTGLDDPRGGMGLALGDVDGDLDQDLFLTNWQLEANALYLSNRHSPFDAKHRRSEFHDATVAAGLGGSIGLTSWGAVFFDLECDGDLDLYVANGYTSPDYESTGICVGQLNSLFRNSGEGRFEDVSRIAGEHLRPALASRAAVGCDYDRDGDVDILVTANNGRVQLLRNEAPRAGRWVGLRLTSTGTNTHAIGAKVRVLAGKRSWSAGLSSGSSYLGGNPPELHFGLGEVEEGASAVVRWPSGNESRHELQLDCWQTLEAPR